MTADSTGEDLYSVLQVGYTATPSEIRRSYQRLAKEYHPDKLSSDLSEEERATAVGKFHCLTKAYETLSDSGRRAEYDSHSNCGGFSQRLPMSDTVDLDEMTFEPESETYSLPCRCGGSYDITEDDMEGGVEILCCSTCTLCVRVLYQLAQENGNKE